MGLLYQIFLDPFVQMGSAPDLLVQTLWEGLVAGVLYSLVALGFVLIFKASGVFNFAQGIMVVFAVLTLIGFYELGVPAFLAVVLALAVMLVLAFAVERLVLRPLVNQSDNVLLMATFGLTYFLIGFGEFLFGGDPKVMISDQLLLPRGAYEIKMFGGFVQLQKLDVAAVVIASNSSFSWWGAWLNRNPGLRVVAPARWLGFRRGVEEPHSVIPKGWIQVPVTHAA